MADDLSKEAEPGTVAASNGHGAATLKYTKGEGLLQFEVDGYTCEFCREDSNVIARLPAWGDTLVTHGLDEEDAACRLDRIYKQNKRVYWENQWDLPKRG